MTETGVVAIFLSFLEVYICVYVRWIKIDSVYTVYMTYFLCRQLINYSLCIWCQQCKLGIVKFIEAKQVPEVETVVHLVVASSDTRHSVATAADLELRSKQR